MAISSFITRSGIVHERDSGFLWLTSRGIVFDQPVAPPIPIDPYGDVAPDVLVYDALWDSLIAQADIATKVRAANRIDMRNWNSAKHEVMWADFPMLIVRDAGNEVDTSASSCSIGVVRTYEIGLATGGDKVDDCFLDLQYAIHLAMRQFQIDAKLLEFEARKFVEDVAFGEPSDITLDTVFEDYVGHLSWATIVRVEVSMKFAKTLL